ncbi:hypothetical protein NL108_003932, partial [Boleophthalmus pectinirostris]
MHIVSLKKGYSLEQALADPEGIAVLGLLIEANETMSKSEPWINLTSHIMNSTEAVNLTDAISISDLIGEVDLTRFYRYEGSLTTPMCNEAVIWTVFEEPIHVSADLVSPSCLTLAELLFSTITKITNIYRPEQDLKGRKVYASPSVKLPSDHGQELWYTLAHSFCGGTRQSPVDITSKDAMVNDLLNSFNFKNFDHKNAIDSVINTGHTVKCVLKDGLVEVSGGGLGHIYSVLQFHFHWADVSSDSRGSEHLLDSKRFPMEMHIVTKRKDLTLDEALMTGNGLAVLGFFIEESSQTTETKAWKLLSGYLSDIQEI